MTDETPIATSNASTDVNQQKEEEKINPSGTEVVDGVELPKPEESQKAVETPEQETPTQG